MQRHIHVVQAESRHDGQPPAIGPKVRMMDEREHGFGVLVSRRSGNFTCGEAEPCAQAECGFGREPLSLSQSDERRMVDAETSSEGAKGIPTVAPATIELGREKRPEIHPRQATGVRETRENRRRSKWCNPYLFRDFAHRVEPSGERVFTGRLPNVCVWAREGINRPPAPPQRFAWPGFLRWGQGMARSRLGLTRCATGMNPSRKERRIAAISAACGVARHASVRNPSAFRRGFERHAPEAARHPLSRRRQAADSSRCRHLRRSVRPPRLSASVLDPLRQSRRRPG